MDQYTTRVLARTEMAEMLKRPEHQAAATNAGLKVADLDALIVHGSAARDADRIQKEQLGQVAVERTGRKVDAEEMFEREEQLRDRLPAVVEDLREAGEGLLANWLRVVSFARFRFREMTPPPGTPPSDPEVKKVERVEREDIPTRADKLVAFCKAVRAKGREPIVAQMDARGAGESFLDTLAADADALARAGRNVVRAAEATAAEDAAATAQRTKWSAVRRMVRKAARSNPALVSKFAEC